MELLAFDSFTAHFNLLSLASLVPQDTTVPYSLDAANTSLYTTNFDSNLLSPSSSFEDPSAAGTSPPLTATTSSSSSNFSPEWHHHSMRCVRVNGRKIIGPPANWTAPAPSIESELFLKRIPKDMNEMKLLGLFEQFGPVYNMRLMVDFCDQNRGFGYVHFVHTDDATMAMNVLQHHFIRPYQTLHLEKSYNKCRLFVSNFPREKSVSAVKAVLHEVFPELSDVVIYKCHSDEGNRGFAFIDFPTHDAAIRAKQQSSIGRCRLFDRDVKVVWANPEHTADMAEAAQDVRTLFVRNVHMSLNNRDIFEVLSQFVCRTDVQKVARVRDLAFIEFRERHSAEKVKAKLHGYEIMNRKLEVNWAIPPKSASIHCHAAVDHDATLRMKCLANNWQPPVYVFGRIFPDHMCQYVAVLLSDGRALCQILMQVNMRCVDLQSRVAEAAVALIESNGRLPMVNYVLVVERDAFHLVGIITCLASATFVKASPLPNDCNLTLHPSEVRDMCQCCMLLLHVPRSSLNFHYAQLIQTRSPLVYLPHLERNQRRFGCIHPGYRNRPPLKHGLQCNAIILSLCDLRTGSNFSPAAALSLERAVPLYDARDIDVNKPNPVCYYRVAMLPSQPADDLVARKAQVSFVGASNLDEIQDMQLSAVVYGLNVCG